MTIDWKWLASLAKRQPMIFVVLILLGAIVYEYPKMQSEIGSLRKENIGLQRECNQRADSLTRSFATEREKLNAETKATLNAMVEDYKKQLEDQRNLNHEVDKALLSNYRILKYKQERLKLITNDR